MSIRKTLAVILCTGSLAGVLSGCEREGPMERTGKKLDKAVEDLSDKKNSPGPAERAGEKVDEAAEEMRERMKEATRP